MSNFELAYNKLSSEGQTDIDEIFKKWVKIWGIKKQKVIDNFRSEHFLSVAHISELLQFLIDNKGMDAVELIVTTRNRIYKKYQLEGEAIKVPNPDFLGFAMGKEDYKDYLMNYCRKQWFDNDEKEIDLFLANCSINIEDYIDFDFLFKSDFKLIWLTWDHQCSPDGPFCFLKYSLSKEICVTLGLDERYNEPPLYLFEIETKTILDKEFNLYRPTFCDADFYENFEPTPQNFKVYGLTQPLTPKIYGPNSQCYVPERRPETVVRSKHIRFNNVIKVNYLNQ